MEKQIISYAEFINDNLDQLKANYNNSDITESDLSEFILYVYTGIIWDCWLPEEYTTGIINKEKQK